MIAIPLRALELTSVDCRNDETVWPPLVVWSSVIVGSVAVVDVNTGASLTPVMVNLSVLLPLLPPPVAV